MSFSFAFHFCCTSDFCCSLSALKTDSDRGLCDFIFLCLHIEIAFGRGVSVCFPSYFIQKTYGFFKFRWHCVQYWKEYRLQKVVICEFSPHFVFVLFDGQLLMDL